jgi:predicted alpha/beta hydrolase family esterase
MQFSSTILILPGLGNSGEGHWQTIWQNRFGFERVEQKDWDAPVCDDWTAAIDTAVVKHGTRNVILVAHSLANTTVAAWAQKYSRVIKGALLVAPSDTEADSYPPGTTGFMPMVLHKLPFPSVTIASANDFYVATPRAQHFAACWGSKLVTIGDAGHINVASGHGEWDEGLQWLKELDKQE